MPATYDLITSGDNITNISSIPQTYTDLVLVIDYIVGTSGTFAGRVRFNGSTDSYPLAGMYNLSTTAYGFTNGGSTGIPLYANNATSPSYGASFTLEIFNYTASIKKGWILYGTNITNSAAPEQSLMGGNWDNTNAINQITLGADAGNISQTSVALYGILRA